MKQSRFIINALIVSQSVLAQSWQDTLTVINKAAADKRTRLHAYVSGARDIIFEKIK